MNLVKTYKTNATEVSYEMLNLEGRLLKKKQSFNYMAYDATDEDYYELAKAIGDLLAYAPKEILKNTLVALQEG